jgi:hypothetical protein
MAWVLGTTPADLVGATIGAPLHAVHTLIAGILNQKVAACLERRRVKETQGVSPSLGLPLLRAAYDESRPELQDMWAALIAAAMDPARAGRVRISFIEVLKKFDPLDALVLRARYSETTTDLKPSAVEFFASRLNVAPNEVRLSADNLITLNCCYRGVQPTAFFITEYGSALVRACQD